MKKAYLYIPIFALVLGVSVAAFWYATQQPATLKLRFEVVVDGDPLIRNQVLYANPGGAGKFKVRDFQFFISNIKLLGDTYGFVDTAGYYLARFDNETQTFTITLEDIPRHQYHKMQLSIGVDAAANGSLASVGALDPNGRMAWNWEVGYKFILFEGGLIAGDVQYPLVYHVGFDDSYRQLVFPLQADFLNQPEPTLVFEVDLMKLFSGVAVIDMQALPSVKFDRLDSQLIANNYAKMIELQP